MSQATEGLNLVLLSGEISKLHAAAMIATVAASFGQPVTVFVSMDALPAFHRDPAVRAGVRSSLVGERIVQSGGDDYLTLFRKAKELGGLTLYACSLVADLFGWTLDSLEPIFDDTLGVAGFLGKAAGGTTLTF